MSVIAGIINDSWVRFPSTISGLNSDFNDASGRLFFASLLCGGICLVKSDNREKTEFLQSINSLTYVSLIIIGVVPYRSFDSPPDQLMLLAIHLLSSGLLVAVCPSLKIYDIWKHRDQKEHWSTRTQTRFIILLLSIVFFIVFIVLQAIIFFQDSEDLQKKIDGKRPPNSGPYLFKTHVSSFVIECICVLLVFIELILSFSQLKYNNNTATPNLDQTQSKSTYRHPDRNSFLDENSDKISNININ
ncbi:hypothetical protein DLAC_02015 [Tieghemostelium lacteum]|uniref:Transmembrane protein n=1 Tax=Tieghemostelium lacteum TaxID=361077 RepID=A0A152A4Z9_TIELA|nr:hypothetical protein DLAC_02015 [Tieghemostelium lacteum]|eukprot:KYR01294.1 hypothetical protein DLAC_02015 [Tieghemostelium lacteum]